MKTFFALIFLLLVIKITVIAQLPVSHVAGKKQALIEDFTGNKCQGCPSGAKEADKITAANPGKAFSIAIHSSVNFSEPDTAASAKDFRTVDGDVIQAMPGIGIASYPAGLINRVVPAYPHITGGLAMYHGFWNAEVNKILSQNSYVNIAGQAYIHPTTRQMVVNIEAYYTANCPVSTNRLSVALLQDDIIAYQKGANNYPAMVVGNDYRHNHVLRDMITNNALGDNISGAKTIGTTYTRTINYSVPIDIPGGAKTIPLVLNDLEMVAYISETSTNIIAVCKIPIIITTSTEIFGPIAPSTEVLSSVSVYPNPMANFGALAYTLTESVPVAVTITNVLGQTVLTENFEPQIGSQKIEFETSNFSDGIYNVTIQAGSKSITKKIIILK